ncbi:U3 small nucleolar RNA-interacting protein 2 isoform X1 [Hydra vulgaris]|uniref:U3 small nucleolar RNA-interacting protein 2 isoform X1 n=1 Tax=Hydra vulgaris TaxID=6087 RepID=UPI001F5E9764|nr:U3 small nucleolar RNA-interacting protein 2 [Hydra vulgaris]
MAGFFLKNKKDRKRKSTVKSNATKLKKSTNKEIESDSDESIVSKDDNIPDIAETNTETAQEKRLRIAKEYIQKLEIEEQEKQLDQEIDKDAIAHRLQQDVLEDVGHLQKFLADKLKPDIENIKKLCGHKLSITSVVISNDNKYLFSASKDGTIIKWNVVTYKKVAKISGSSKQSDKKCHSGQVLCLALTTDFTFLASGGHDMVIHIWNPETLDWIHTFKGHRKQISALAFRHKQHQLFSASDDKTIKVWSLDEMAYVETLFGHEDTVLGIDSLFRDCAVSCGGRDRSIRLWKIPEESQLVFQSNMPASFDCVTMLNEEYFLAGSDDGSLSIFYTRKKKPITLRTNSHKITELSGSVSKDSWITSVACVPFSDIVASGSCDGCIKLWRCDKSFRSLMLVHSIKMPGFINSLKFSSDFKYLIAGVGQEHRLGRWRKINEAKNLVCVIPLIMHNESEALTVNDLNET